ncbi:hybrid sensor histidine kinase/response regulator [Chiayiivirga flava]|uniref:histidine kinase n=1 Tax=Chiayiivirga flava TaxID=659595 RepID=A0A7W8FYU2_9GAMM|nr:hybrid sensor histidine kinase/response regulator [Chiayiivirga flava]MBB5206499.1 signal transduction histidine kinase [Chiayiivirga flava]
MTPPTVLPPVKCLLVDDLDENLLALGALLEGGDVEILTARSGSQALELLLAHDIALVLLDVQMPGMDGFEVAEFMRGSKRTRHVPIIFVTASGSDRLRLFKGYDAGAVDFLHKPIEPHVLRSKVGVFVELHRQRLRLADELRERTEALRLSQMFMAVLGHDLRSPLNTMVMGANLLNAQLPPERLAHVAELITSCGQRMKRMIADLLDVARARVGGGLAVQPRREDLRALAERIAAEQRLLYPTRTLELACVGDLEGEWDPDRLAQMFTNLAGNALDHGGDQVPVRIRVDGTSPDEVRIVFANAGAIPADVLEHLFDPFHGAQRPRGRDDGLGLGLYIAERIVHAHRGRIAVQSNATDGTAIEVLLPRRNVPADGASWHAHDAGSLRLDA